MPVTNFKYKSGEFRVEFVHFQMTVVIAQLNNFFANILMPFSEISFYQIT